MRMVFEPLASAAKLVTIVEELASSKSQLESLEKGGEVRKCPHLAAVTLDLALIARQLFLHAMKMNVDLSSTTPSSLHPVISTGPTTLDYKTEDIEEDQPRAAALCHFGVHCNFGAKGICSYFHPEPGKSRHVVSGSPFCKMEQQYIYDSLIVFILS